jgi:hypothetical protein
MNRIKILVIFKLFISLTKNIFMIILAKNMDKILKDGKDKCINTVIILDTYSVYINSLIKKNLK